MCQQRRLPHERPHALQGRERLLGSHLLQQLRHRTLPLVHHVVVQAHQTRDRLTNGREALNATAVGAAELWGYEVGAFERCTSQAGWESNPVPRLSEGHVFVWVKRRQCLEMA